MCELIHCVQRYTGLRSPFRVDCEKKFPSVNFFYTSAAIDAMDKYQVCICWWWSGIIPHVLGQAQYTNGETRWTGKGSLECQNHEVSDTKHPFFVIYVWTDHCNPFNWSPAHSTGPQSIQLVPKFQYWLIQCQNGQFWQNELILSFHCAFPQPSQLVPGSFNWSSTHSTGPQTLFQIFGRQKNNYI